MNKIATLDQLEQVVDKLDSSSQTFAKDLIRKGKKYGLSEKQAYWVNKLYDRATGKEQQPKPTKLAGNLAPMMDMLKFAATHLKAPKVRLLTPEAQAALDSGQPVDREWLKCHTLRLGVAGARSKYTGQVNVSDDHAYGWNVWYGRIDPLTGEWTKPRKELDLMPQVAQALQDFSDDPVQAATAYGKLMGHCCFCNLPLTDRRSVDVGYGPDCAKHWGLPWGSRS